MAQSLIQNCMIIRPVCVHAITCTSVIFSQMACGADCDMAHLHAYTIHTLVHFHVLHFQDYISKNRPVQAVHLACITRSTIPSAFIV